MRNEIKGNSLEFFMTQLVDTGAFSCERDIISKYRLDRITFYEFLKEVGKVNPDGSHRDENFQPPPNLNYGCLVKANNTLYYSNNWWKKCFDDVSKTMILAKYQNHTRLAAQLKSKWSFERLSDYFEIVDYDNIRLKKDLSTKKSGRAGRIYGRIEDETINALGTSYQFDRLYFCLTTRNNYPYKVNYNSIERGDRGQKLTIDNPVTLEQQLKDYTSSMPVEENKSDEVCKNAKLLTWIASDPELFDAYINGNKDSQGKLLRVLMATM